MAGTVGAQIWLAYSKCFEKLNLFLRTSFIFVIIWLISPETRTTLLASCIVGLRTEISI